MVRHYLLLISIVSLLSACSIYQVTSEDTTSNYYPSKESADDVVYLEEAGKPYDIIGYISVKTERRQTISEVIDRMKKEAAILGADAIINIQTDGTGTWKRLPAQKIIGNGYVRANFTATAIVFK